MIGPAPNEVKERENPARRAWKWVCFGKPVKTRAPVKLLPVEENGALSGEISSPDKASPE
jgi:hypothetical protein